MSTVADETAMQQSDPSQRLRNSMAAMRVSFSWFGTRKSLSTEQRALAADAFDAEGKFLSAGKKLVDTSDPAFRNVTSIRNQTVAYFKGISLPYPEPGLRLVPQGSLQQIDAKMRDYRDELSASVERLEARFDELKYEARDRLGDLFCDADYPATLSGLFDVSWDFPSVEPPEYLRRLNPEMYQQECDRIRSRFNDAVQMAETAFVEELSKLVDHLGERLAGNDDGKPKVFRDTVVTNLNDFFERFQRLNIGSSGELDSLVERSKLVVGGIVPQQLRDSSGLRQQISTQLSSVQSALDGLLVDRPRRNIIRGAR